MQIDLRTVSFFTRLKWRLFMFFCCKKTEKSWEEKASADQEAVMDSYRKNGSVSSRSDEEMLHMFFSPTRVPRGLTNEMVQTCILLYPLRRKEHDMHMLLQANYEPIITPKFLPRELMPTLWMTRKRFYTGISKYLANLAQLVIQVEQMQRSGEPLVLHCDAPGMP